MKQFIKDYFTFTRKEGVAILLLCALMGLFLALPWMLPEKPLPPLPHQLEADLQKVRELLAVDSTEKNDGNTKSLFLFDPNLVTAAQWAELGLRDKTIRTILNYRNKGGTFRKPEDIRKIWGLGVAEADRLLPYVRIQNKKEGHGIKNEYSSVKSAIPTTPIDINTATIETWKSLPGIGDVLAARIVKFRDKMGGFQTLEQVGKTYGLSDTIFRKLLPYLRLSRITVERLDLNRASAWQLMQQAKLPESVAKNIIAYRQQHGPFTSFEILKTALDMPDSVLLQLTNFCVIK